MGQSTPFRRLAIVVEDEDIQREMITLLFCYWRKAAFG